VNNPDENLKKENNENDTGKHQTSLYETNDKKIRMKLLWQHRLQLQQQPGHRCCYYPTTTTTTTTNIIANNNNNNAVSNIAE